MHDMSTTRTYAEVVVQFGYDPLDAGGVREAKKVLRQRDAKGRFVTNTKKT